MDKKKLSTIISTIIFVVALIFGAYYMFTGSDPLGLFTEPTPTSIPPASEDGSWWEVYFTDPATINDSSNLSGSIPEILIDYIDQAQKTIHIASFEFNLTPVAEALVDAHERGVEIIWITDDEHGIEADEEEGHGQFAMLKNAGIQVLDDGRSGLMHNKFWIFDEQILWSGSTNITKNGNFRNNNNVIVLHSPQVAAIYEREFSEMLAGEFGVTSTSTLSKQTAEVNGTIIQVLFASEDDVMGQLLPLVERAEKSIKFMAFSFTHDDLGNAMVDFASRGGDVQGIFETRGSETPYSELTTFYCEGIPVRQDGNPGTFHHKIIIIDNKIVVTGSLNFSNNGLSSNDENALIIYNAEIASLYLEEFERRWAEATTPDPNDLECK